MKKEPVPFAGTASLGDSSFGGCLFQFCRCPFGLRLLEDLIEKLPDEAENKYPLVQLPDGYQIEKVVGGLNLPTSITWDNEGNMFVAEAGGGLEPEQKAPIRIMQVKDGQATEAVNLTGKGVNVSVVGLTWHNGAFYFTHRANDLTGAVSMATKAGQVQQLFSASLTISPNTRSTTSGWAPTAACT